MSFCKDFESALVIGPCTVSYMNSIQNLKHGLTCRQMERNMLCKNSVLNTNFHKILGRKNLVTGYRSAFYILRFMYGLRIGTVKNGAHKLKCSPQTS